jgi:hypothetical protein
MIPLMSSLFIQSMVDDILQGKEAAILGLFGLQIASTIKQAELFYPMYEHLAHSKEAAAQIPPREVFTQRLKEDFGYFLKIRNTLQLLLRANHETHLETLEEMEYIRRDGGGNIMPAMPAEVLLSLGVNIAELPTDGQKLENANEAFFDPMLKELCTIITRLDALGNL